MGAFVTPLRGRSARLQGQAPSVRQGPSGFSQQLMNTAGALNKFAALEERKRKAIEASTAAKRIAAATEQLSQLRFDLPQDPNLHPFDRRAAFNSQAEKLLSRVGEGLSQEVANEAMAKLQAKATTLANSMDLEATKEFVAEEQESLEAEIAIYQKEYVRAETPEEQELTLSNLASSLQSRVDAGVITESQMELFTSEFLDGTAEVAVDTAVNIDPQGMFEHVLDLMRGGSGTDGLPIPRDLNATFQAIQNELKERYAFEDRQERIEEKRLNKAKDAAGFDLFSRVLANEDSEEALDALFHETVNTVKAKKTSEQWGTSILRLIGSQQRAIAEGTNVDDDVEVIRRAYKTMTYDPIGTRDSIISQVGVGLRPSTANTLLNMTRDIEQDSHFLRHPNVKQAMDYIGSQFGPNSPFAAEIRIDDSTLRAIRGDAEHEFVQRIQAMSGPRGAITQAALDAIPDLQERIIEVFKRHVKEVAQGEVASRPPIANTVPALILRGKAMVEAGTDPNIVRNILVRDIHALFVQGGGDPTDPLALAAYRAEILQNLGIRQSGGSTQPSGNTGTTRGTR